ncbi:MAG: hypothetical protein ACFFE4_08025 [Candidatus Thorarchaeota archaeon]
MENDKNLEIIAQKNLDIAEYEKLIYKESKIVVKQELKSTKARALLAKNEIKLAKLKQILAEKSKKLNEIKGNAKDILNFSNNNLKNEEDYTIYNLKIAEIKKAIAEVQRKIASLEKQKSEVELKIIKEKLEVAKERELLGNRQLNFVKLLKKSTPNGKLAKAKETYLNQQKKLNKAIREVYKKSIEIRRNEDKLADFKKELSEKLTLRERIRPPSAKFPTNI